MFHYHAVGPGLESYPYDPGKDGLEKCGLITAEKEYDDIFRGLLQHFKKAVLGLLVHPLRIGDDIDFTASQEGSDLRSIDYLLPDLIHLYDIRLCSVQPDHIRMVP